jgi:hypothetical protein
MKRNYIRPSVTVVSLESTNSFMTIIAGSVYSIDDKKHDSHIGSGEDVGGGDGSDWGGDAKGDKADDDGWNWD